MPASGPLTPQAARDLLGLEPLAGPLEIRRAFREAAKLAHPDRPSGDAARFRQVIAAHELLRGAGLALPGPPPVLQDTISITPRMALEGGAREVALADGRRIRIALPAGLRDGERLRAAAVTFTIAVAQDGDTQVRGDDLWITAHLSPATRAEGG